MKWDAIVLAAGSGTRMKSKTPKVLQQVAGTSMIVRILRALTSSGCDKIHLVISESILKEIKPLQNIYPQLEIHIQNQPKGTGDAVLSVPEKDLGPNVFICNGDHPLMASEDILKTLEVYSTSEADLLVSSLILNEPGSFGRIIKANEEIEKIVEAKDATSEELAIQEINAGLYFGKARNIYSALNDLKDKSRSTEFYLTDIVQIMKKTSARLKTFITTEDMAFGVNDPRGLYLANKKAYQKNALNLLNQGVKFIDIKSTYIDDDVQVGQDTLIYPNVFLKQNSSIGEACTLESGVHVFDSHIGDETYLKAGSYIEKTKVKGSASIGPYARLREGTLVDKNVKIGNFVETKKVHLKTGVKAGHQCYLGDSEIGENTNIGAGTITCNFAVDGKKYKTKIGKNAFIGSDTQIVPPVEIGDGAVIAAGATVTKDVDPEALYVTRAKAFVKKNYKVKD